MRPETDTTTDLAYDSLGPFARADERQDYVLLRFLHGMMRQLDEIEQLSRDTDDHDGWGRLLDLDTVPDFAVGWLAQFIGVTPLSGLDTESQRIRIREAAGWRRGSVESLRGAARQYLTGSRTVQVFERYGGHPYRVLVRTYASETPNVGQVREALLALKPAGLVLTYETADGQSYDQLEGTYTDVRAQYRNYNDIRFDIPPEV